MEQEGVYKALRLLDSAKYSYVLGDTQKAKKDGMTAIGILNEVLKSKIGDKTKVKRICQDALDLYQNLGNPKYFSVDEKLAWMGSIVNGEFFPPIDTENLIVSEEQLNDELHLSEEQKRKLLGWESINEQNQWTTDGMDHLFQDYLQDCSFVASLISLSKFNSEKLFDLIQPHKPSGRYGVILHFNGCQRLVEVGDQLPKLNGECLYIKSRNNDRLLWVAMIEKAYLKVQGYGYEAKGSNASIDTYIVSGWIPEFIHASQRVNLSELWSDLFEKFQTNQIVLSLGTGKYSEEYYPNHDYSVLELIEDTRSVKIKNPWEDSITSVPFEELFGHFDTLYINWNPSKLIHKKLNFIWKDNDNIFFDNPQFHIRNEDSSTTNVWVLIEKHLGFEESSVNALIYQTNGQRLFSKEKTLTLTSANNSGFHLSKFKLGLGQSATIVITNDSKQTQNFTIHSYSTKEVSVMKAKPLFPFLKTIKGQWDVDSCGGSWSHQTYIKNPQYEINVPPYSEDVKVTFGLYSRNDALVNFRLYFADDKPFSGKSSLINEKYQAKQLTHFTTLKPGNKYKLVLSTYDPDVLAPFRLVVNSEVDLSITQISTRLGLFLQSFKFNWNGKNRFKLRFKVPRETGVNVHIWTDNFYSNYRPKIRASLFYSNGRPIQINSDFDDSLYGIWLQDVTISPTDSVILLIERFEIGNDEMLIELGSDQKIEPLI